MTRRPLRGPRSIWIPLPGPVAYHVQFFAFTSEVISRGGVHVTPSSVECMTKTRRPYLPVWSMIQLSRSPPLFQVVSSQIVAGVAVDDGAGIAAGIAGVVPDDVLRGPGLAVIEGTFEEQVDIAAVTAATLAAFAKGQDGSCVGNR